MVFYMNYTEKQKNNKNVAIRSPRKLTFANRVKNYLKEYCNATGIHGFRYLAESRSKIESIFWGVVIILSIIGCLIMICAIINKYQENPVVVSFSTRNTPIFEIPFPAVTICSETKYTRSQKLDYSRISSEFSSNNTLTDEELQKLHYMSLLCDNQDIRKKIIKTGENTFTDHFFHVICKVRSRFFFGQQCSFLDAKYKCEDIFKPVIVDEGLCYSFNMLDKTEIFRDHVYFSQDFYQVNVSSEEYYNVESGFTNMAKDDTYPRRVLVSGADNALTINFVYNFTNTDYLCSSYMDGFRVLIHNPIDIPRLSKHYFSVPVGQRVTVAVQPEHIKTSAAAQNLVPDKRECYLSTERPLQHFKIYTQSNCLLECLTNYTLSHCGCVAFFMPRDNKTEICGTAKLNCLYEAEKKLKYDYWKSEVSDFENDETICDCMPSCTELTYNVEISHNNFYWKGFIESLGLVPEKEFGYSVLSIYFKSEQFMGIKRNELYGTSDLISNFGGLFGLFTGFSIISLIEIIYFLTVRIYYLIYNKKLYGIWSGSSIPKQDS